MLEANLTGASINITIPQFPNAVTSGAFASGGWGTPAHITQSQTLPDCPSTIHVIDEVLLTEELAETLGIL